METNYFDSNNTKEVTELASYSKRFWANLIDASPTVFWVILNFINIILEVITELMLEVGENLPLLNSLNELIYQITLLSHPLTALAVLTMFVINIVLLAKSSQTIGKKMLNIKIVDNNTSKDANLAVTFIYRMVVNSIIIILTCGIYTIIDSLFIFRKDRRCIHDLISNTKVVNVD